MMSGTVKESQKSNTEANRFLIGLIADYETVVGFLLAGIGEYIDPQKKLRNYMMVTEETPMDMIETFFRALCDTKKVGVILIGTEIYKSLLSSITQRAKMIPIIIEIPSRKGLEDIIDNNY